MGRYGNSVNGKCATWPFSFHSQDKTVKKVHLISMSPAMYY